MDDITSDRNVNPVTGSGDNGGVLPPPADAAQQTAASGVEPDLRGLDQQLAARSRRNGRRSLLFVLILTGGVMVFAIIVAVWMYWLAPALTV